MLGDVARPMTDEGELAARPEQQPRSRRSPAMARGTGAASPISTIAFEHDQPDNAGDSRQRFAGKLAHVDAHADGEEEDAEQQAAERIDRRLDGAAELGLGEQQAGDERAERHRETAGRGQEAAADATSSVAATKSSVFALEATSRNSGRSSDRADDDDDAIASPPGRRPCMSAVEDAPAARGEDRHEQEQRHDGQILQQQDREAARPVAVASRCWRDRSSTTIAVEESARLKPMIVAATGSWPSRLRPKPMTAAEMAT